MLAEILSKLLGHEVLQPTVSTWLGSARPRADHANALQRVASVPIDAWFQPVATTSSGKAA